MLVPVDDPDDPRLAPFRWRERGLASRPERRDPAGRGWFVAEGDLVVERALAAGCRPVALLVDDRRPPPLVERLDPDVPVYGAGPDLRRRLTGLGVPLDAVAVLERPAMAELSDLLAGARRLVVLEAVDNPTNVGAIVRTLAVLGWDGLVLDRTSADPLARRALRVAMGLACTVPWARADDLARALTSLTASGVRTIALTPDPAAIALADVAADRSDRVAIVLGAERAGLSPETMAACSARVRIPLVPGADSLNVAAAAAIACYALAAR